MLHILWLIVKIIGILLLILLGVILLILLSILFVPLRYHGQGVKEEERLEAEIRISWFLHILHVVFWYKDGKADWNLRIFGISIRKLGKLLEKRKRKSDPVQPIVNSIPIEEPIKKSSVNESGSEKKNGTSVTAEKIQQVQPSELEDERLCLWEKAEKVLGAVWKTIHKVITCIWNVIQWIFLLPVRICNGIRKICFTIDRFCDKIKKWKEFLKDFHTREAWNLVKKSLGKTIRHILPKKMKGNVIFGFEDPAATGQTLAALSVFYPLYYKKLSLVPVFDRAILEGNIKFSGRIYGIFFVKTALKIWMDQHVKITIKRFRQMGNI